MRQATEHARQRLPWAKDDDIVRLASEAVEQVRREWQAAGVPDFAEIQRALLGRLRNLERQVWKPLLDLSQRVAKARLRWAPSEDVEDIAQEALILLKRRAEAGPVENFEAMLTAILRNRIGDYIRSKRRAGLLPLENEDGSPIEVPVEEEDPFETVFLFNPGDLQFFRFLLCEFFRAQTTPVRPSCLDVSIRVFAGWTLQRVSADFGDSYVAVRKRWSRCMERAQTELREEIASLIPWAREAGVLS